MFDSLGPGMAVDGAVRLPAPAAGAFGAGACIDAVGATNCITLESNALGCPYQPDLCPQVHTGNCQINESPDTKPIFFFKTDSVILSTTNFFYRVGLGPSG